MADSIHDLMRARLVDKKLHIGNPRVEATPKLARNLIIAAVKADAIQAGTFLGGVHRWMHRLKLRQTNGQHQGVAEDIWEVRTPRTRSGLEIFEATGSEEEPIRLSVTATGLIVRSFEADGWPPANPSPVAARDIVPDEYLETPKLSMTNLGHPTRTLEIYALLLNHGITPTDFEVVVDWRNDLAATVERNTPDEFLQRP
jgi:hypothetical protein